MPVLFFEIINACAINRDSGYLEDAKVFMPKRFKDNDINYKGLHFQFLSCGSGQRVRLGMSLDVVAIEITLANLLYR